MATVQRKLPPGANQTRSGDKKLGRQENENNPPGFAQVRFRHLGNHDPQQTCQRRRRIRVQAWRQYATHPLTLRLIEAGQENPLAQVSTGKLYEVQKYCALSNHCWSGYWIVANRRALSSLPADLVDIVNSNFDAAAIKERADLQEMDRSLQAELAGKGMTFNKPDPVQFRAALVKAGFYTQWQKTYGAEAWARLEQYTGRLT
jgi:hypothetical protein